MNCIDKSLYECEQTKINCLFACEVLKDYKQKRYGIKSCKKDLNNNYLNDLKQLLEYSLELNLKNYDINLYRNKLFNEEYIKEGTNEFNKTSLNVCNTTNLLEKINLL